MVTSLDWRIEIEGPQHSRTNLGDLVAGIPYTGLHPRFVPGDEFEPAVRELMLSGIADRNSNSATPAREASMLGP